jgi:hypothetical protein
VTGCCESTLYMKVHYGEHVFAVCASFSQHRVEVSALAGVSVQGKFDHPEAVQTPPGGGMVARSIGRYAHVTPRSWKPLRSASPCATASRCQARLEASARAGVSVPGEFDHPEADPTPPGGGMVARLIGRHAHLTPCSWNRYDQHAARDGAERSEARLEASARAGVSVPWEFDHPEAGPTPPGGGPAG